MVSKAALLLHVTPMEAGKMTYRQYVNLASCNAEQWARSDRSSAPAPKRHGKNVKVITGDPDNPMSVEEMYEYSVRMKK